MHCRINRQRQWVTRILLEERLHKQKMFVTLTYDELNVPHQGYDRYGVPVLDPEDLQNFLKRLRKRIQPNPVRFFAVGEYGTRTFRPHYHALLFGLGPAYSDLVEDCWRQGFVSIGDMTAARAYYTGHYTTKKMTHKDDPRLDGRPPEFMRSSRREGIGVPYIPYLADAYRTKDGVRYIAKHGDISYQVRIGQKLWPLDQLMREKLREEIGIAKYATDRLLDESKYEETPVDLDLIRLSEAKKRRRLKKHGWL